LTASLDIELVGIRDDVTADYVIAGIDVPLGSALPNQANNELCSHWLLVELLANHRVG